MQIRVIFSTSQKNPKATRKKQETILVKPLSDMSRPASSPPSSDPHYITYDLPTS